MPCAGICYAVVWYSLCRAGICYAVPAGMCYAVVLWITHRDLPRLHTSGIKHQPNRPVSFSQLEQTVHFQTTKLTNAIKKLATPVTFGMTALVSQVAHAGPALPWDGPITTIVNNLTGPVATGISTVAFLAAGAALIFGGDDLGGIAKKLLYVVLGVALIVFGANFLSMIGLVNSGALI
jgi:type IV secretion system protein VirB2